MAMHLWKIVPVTRPEDSYWQGRPVWREVIVAAESATRARMLAAEMERRTVDPAGILKRGDFNSGFLSEKLYEVIDLTAEAERLGHALNEARILSAARLGEP